MYTYLIVAVEKESELQYQNDYTLWFLDLDQQKNLCGVGKIKKSELMKNLFEKAHKKTKSVWKVLSKHSNSPRKISLLDFASLNLYENTHLGDLPTLEHFQSVLASLQQQNKISLSA